MTTFYYTEDCSQKDNSFIELNQTSSENEKIKDGIFLDFFS